MRTPRLCPERPVLFQAVKSAIIDQNATLERPTVTEESTYQSLGLDSLDVIELTMTIEENLEVEIDDSKVSTVGCVREIVDYLEREWSSISGPAGKSPSFPELPPKPTVEATLAEVGLSVSPKPSRTKELLRDLARCYEEETGNDLSAADQGTTQYAVWQFLSGES